MDTAERILYVGDFGRQWNTEVHVQHALGELGHTVLAMPEAGVSWSALPRKVREHRISLVLWTHSVQVPADVRREQREVLAMLRDMGVPTVSFHLDRWWGLSLREHQVADDPFFRTDLVVTADGGHADRWQMAGVRHAWLPPAVHGPEVGRGTYRPTLAADVCFVGGVDHYPHPEWRDERQRLVRWAERRYGDRFRVWPTDRRLPVRGSDLNDVYASTKVVLGDSCLAGAASHYWSDRVPETLGRGGLLVHPHVDGMADWYTNGQELVTFDLGDLDQLGRTIDDWLDAPEASRRGITDQALELVAGRDTYVHRMREVLAMAKGDPMRPGWLDGREGRVQVGRGGLRRAVFDLRPASTDGTVLREVWQQDHYRMADADVAGRLVVDVGAHIGSFTVLAAKLGAQVVAVEPNPENVARLLAHVDANGVADRVQVVEAAAADIDRTVPFVMDTSGSHISHYSGHGLPRVRAVPLPKLLAEAGLAGEPIAVLKMDCEGGEYLNLHGLAEVLPGVDRAVFEFHGPRMPHMGHLAGTELGPLVVVLAEHGVVEVAGRPSTGGMIYWRRHR